MPKAFYFAKSPGMDRNTEPFWVLWRAICVPFALHEVKIHDPVQQQTLTTVRGLDNTRRARVAPKGLLCRVLTNHPAERQDT